MFNAGDFNKRIILRYETGGGYDEYGYPIPGQPVDKKIWAKVIPVSAKEYYEAKTLQAENVMRFIVRYRTEIKYDMQIIYKDQTYEIESIINDYEKNKTLTIIGRNISKVGQ